jgi:molybdopterin/thiamine biosynthesis adenylyltransferase
METNFSEAELSLKRFARHFLLPGFTHEHQARLHRSRIVIVGMGGLGNTVAQCLSAAGVGAMTIIDFDIVEESNLARQILFNEKDLGNAKAHVACKKLSEAYPEIKFYPRNEMLGAENSEKLLAHHDLILDCCDLARAKYDIDAAAAALKIPVVFGAVNRFDGQVAVFHGKLKSSYTETFPRKPEVQPIDNCNSLGVWSPSVGIIGNMMSQEALTMLAFGNSKLDGLLLNIQLADYECYLLKLNSNTNSQEGSSSEAAALATTISAADVEQLRTLHEDLRIIWLKNDDEVAPVNERVLSMSLDELLWTCSAWDKHSPVVLQCSNGIKSMQGALYLSGEGFTRVFHSRGE